MEWGRIALYMRSTSDQSRVPSSFSREIAQKKEGSGFRVCYLLELALGVQHKLCREASVVSVKKTLEILRLCVYG